MRILIVGAGGTGGFFGGRLTEAGRDVAFLVRGRRAAALREKGLRIQAPKGTTTIRVKTLQASGLDRPFDLVILAVKAYSLDAALDDVAPAVGPSSLILPLLNGMRHIERLTDRFGKAPVLGGLCAIMATVSPAGDVVQTNDAATLTFGELGGGPSDRLQPVLAALQGAGFEAKLSENVRQDLWDKWVMLSTLGATTCLLRAPIGKIEAAPGGPEFLNATLDEAVAAARAAGFPPSPRTLTWVRGLVTAPGSPATSSMYRDMAAGGPVEVDAILGDLVGRAKSLGVETPRLAAARTALEIYDRARQVGELAKSS